MISFSVSHGSVRNRVQVFFHHGARGEHGVPHIYHGRQGCEVGHVFRRVAVEVQCAEVHSDISLNLLVHAQLSYPVHHDPAKPHGSSGNNQFQLPVFPP